jgi:CRP-like cAMP-binding protein
VAWICPLFLPVTFSEQEYVFFEGDDIGCIFFLTKGECSFVLPKHDNQKYVKVNEGGSFGAVDIMGSVFKNDVELETWFSRKDVLKRQFSTMASTYCEMMSLSVQDLYRIQVEFLEYYEYLINEKTDFLQKLLLIKLAAIKVCNQIELK